MESFYSLLSPENPDPFDDEKESVKFFSQIDTLIHLYIKKNIEIYNPQYSFEEVEKSIRVISISDTDIEFAITIPYTGLEEKLGFGLEYAKTLQQDKKTKVEEILDKTFSQKDEVNISPHEIGAIISSWLPDLNLENIQSITKLRLKGKTIFYFLEDEKGFDYLWLSFYGEDNKLTSRTVPCFLRGEYTGTVNGNMFMVNKHQERTQEILDSIIGVI